MALQINIGTFSKLIYLTLLELNQPFTFDECLSAVQSAHPFCTEKLLRSRIKEMVRKKLLAKHRIKKKIYYNCLISKEVFLTAKSAPPSAYQHNFFICEL